MQGLSGLFPQEIANWLQTYQIPAFRAKQIFHWLHVQGVLTFSEMANLPRPLLKLLESQLESPLPLAVADTKKASDGTEKFLFSLQDGNTIETVLIPQGRRHTVCVSSQVGCAMNCSFCATGQAGFVRDLKAAEIVAQVLWAKNHLASKGLALTNVVYMGMGEPLANYEAVLKSIRLLNLPAGMNLGIRRFTLSTSGLVPQIINLAREGLPLNLAVSLHAPTDAQRSELMPINKRFPLKELLEACRFYQSQTGRRLSFEYVLIKGWNDDAQSAYLLKDLLQDIFCHVNLIPVNPTAGEKRPAPATTAAFAQILEKNAISVTVRQEKGADIKAACGQLRQRHNSH